VAKRFVDPNPTVKIAVVGKYTGSQDSYISVINALKHAALESCLVLEIVWINSSDLEQEEGDPPVYNKAIADLGSVDGVLVPGGFGDRGIQGKIRAGQFCRENNVPYLGICLAFQTAVIEFARNVCGLNLATSEEFNGDSTEKVIIFMPETRNIEEKGGTMRLGSRKTLLTPGSVAHKLYSGKPEVWERHRHRYEVNPAYIERLESKGLMFSGRDETGERMEIAEYRDHPYYLSCQFHPEFHTWPTRSHPLFRGLILASKKRLSDEISDNILSPGFF
jgi:CTP synthase